MALLSIQTAASVIPPRYPAVDISDRPGPPGDAPRPRADARRSGPSSDPSLSVAGPVRDEGPCPCRRAASCRQRAASTCDKHCLSAPRPVLRDELPEHPQGREAAARRVQALIGPNNEGKSNILQAM